MGEEALTPLDLLHPAEAAPGQEKCEPLQEYRRDDPMIDEGRCTSEMETVRKKGEDSSDPTNATRGGIEEASENLIETFKEDCLITSPLCKGMASPNMPSAFRFLATKYNSLMERYQMLTRKCTEECGPRFEELKKKYTEECSERKRLYNELIELRGNIRVFCRCRPLSSEEISKGHSSILDLDPSQDTELQIICSDSSKKQFKFDHVFGPTDDQETVFAETVPVVKSVLDGYNVCIFAYGQTGTGKTFTMEGTPDNRGVNYRALEQLFRSSNDRSSSVKYDFCVSMLEIYNEKIRDLLAENSDQPAKKLEIKQAADGTQEVPGLVESPIYTIDEVWEMLKTGARNRSVGSTNANELSSRSHCLVRVTVKTENLVNAQRGKSHMWLVDLAGSERVGKIEVEGERLKESQFINKSLSALGDVISALASKNPHIPYRNSKLTHLLQSSLGGDCKTLMFVQISPSSGDLGETICSLNFATRVRGIEHGPVRKQSDPAESFKFKQMMEKLRQEEKETARLNESLQLMHLKYASRENVFRTLQEKIREAEQTCRNYQQRVRDLESKLAEEKKTASHNTAKLSKPPLAPLKQRPPLVRITNHFPPAASQTRRTSMMPPHLVQNKENIPATSKASSSEISNNVGKARRISLIPIQHKRRSSFAMLPIAEKGWQSGLSDSRASLQASQLRVPRRRSVATLSSIPIPATPLPVTKFRATESSSKYSSPPTMSALWKLRIPTISSPRQRLRLVSSPAIPSNLNDAQRAPSKLCFSVQKRVIVGSPSRLPAAVLSGSGIFNQALRERNTAGRWGGSTQRVLCTKRRMSVM